MFEWIAVGVELPDDAVTVLVWAPEEVLCEVFAGFREAGEWFTVEGYPLLDESVTHWGHLPDPPQA